jgi:hypothetical protein
MSDVRSNTIANADSVGLDDVIRTAGDVADRVREAAASVARLGERELAMLVGIAEDIRDRTVARERLDSARKIETIASLRQTAHRSVDLGFDMAAVGVDVGVDFVDAALRRPAKPAASQSSAPAAAI